PPLRHRYRVRPWGAGGELPLHQLTGRLAADDAGAGTPAVDREFDGCIRAQARIALTPSACANRVSWSQAQQRRRVLGNHALLVRGYDPDLIGELFAADPGALSGRV